MRSIPVFLFITATCTNLVFAAQPTPIHKAKDKSTVGQVAAPVRGKKPELRPLTLPNAISMALEKNPELHASGSKTEAAAGQADQAGRWSNPELQLSLEDWPVRGAGWSESKRTVGMAQTLPFPGKKRLERQIGAAGVRLSQAELGLRRVEIVRDVKVAFYQVLSAEELVKVGGDLVKTAETLYTSVEKRVEAGDASEQEKLRMAVPLEKARMDLADFHRNLAASRKMLATLLGCSDLNEWTVAGTLTETGDPTRLEKLPEGHPSRLAAQVNVARAELAVRRARLEIYPDVTVGAGMGREAITNNSIGEVRVGLPLPLFDNSSGKRREARANSGCGASKRGS